MPRNGLPGSSAAAGVRVRRCPPAGSGGAAGTRGGGTAPSRCHTAACPRVLQQGGGGRGGRAGRKSVGTPRQRKYLGTALESQQCNTEWRPCITSPCLTSPVQRLGRLYGGPHRASKLDLQEKGRRIAVRCGRIGRDLAAKGRQAKAVALGTAQDHCSCRCPPRTSVCSRLRHSGRWVQMASAV